MEQEREDRRRELKGLQRKLLVQRDERLSDRRCKLFEYLGVRAERNVLHVGVRKILSEPRVELSTSKRRVVVRDSTLSDNPFSSLRVTCFRTFIASFTVSMVGVGKKIIVKIRNGKGDSAILGVDKEVI